MAIDSAPWIDTIGDEALNELNSWIGVALRIPEGSSEATYDNVRFFAYGHGDLNPLWIDREYGRQSSFGVNLAPPTYLNTVFSQGIVPGRLDLQALYAGTRWTWHDRVRMGDSGLHADARLTDVQLKTTATGAKRILHTGLTRYYRLDADGADECIAEAAPSYFRLEISGPNKGVSYAPREPTQWTVEELIGIGKETLAGEVRRGSDPRCWDDVRVGDRLGPLVKGPYDQLDQVTHAIGTRGHYHPVAYDGWWLHLDDDPESGTNHLPMNPLGKVRRGRGHWEEGTAKEFGMPGAYDGGPMRISVMSGFITNWMGDAGFLRMLEVRIRQPVIPGDLIRVTGEVAEILTEGEPRRLPGEGPMRPVRITLDARNQLGQIIASGGAVVDLPLRSAGTGSDLRI